MQPINAAFQTLVDSDRRRPIGRVSTYDTTKSVPSKGFNASFHGIAATTAMEGADWWTALPNTTPPDRVSEGTFLDGASIIEPSTVLAFDWGPDGVPGPITGRTDLWAVRWYGSFFPRYTGVYRFYLDSNPLARYRISIGGTYLTLKDPADDTTIVRWNATNRVNTRKEVYADSAALTAGTWVAISVEYQIPLLSDPQNMPNYFCVKYREPNTTTNLDLWGNTGGDIVTDYSSDFQDADLKDIKKPLSAGVVNVAGAFETSVAVPGVAGFRGMRRDGEVAEFSFGINLPASTNIAVATTLPDVDGKIQVDSVAGFPSKGALKIGTSTVTYTGKNTALNEFTGCAGGSGAVLVDDLVSQFVGSEEGYDPLEGTIGNIRPFTLVRIEGGLHDGTATDHYSDRIWGNVFPGPVLNRDRKTVDVRVRDTAWGLMDEYDRNYPDQASYSMASYYLEFTVTTPDGLDRPAAYDRWNVARAVRDLFIKGGVDPVLLYQRERLQVSASPLFASDYGQYLIRSDATMDSRPNYGRPWSTGEGNPDDQYVWFFGYGTKLYQNLLEIVKNYSFKVGMTPAGYGKFQPYGLPDDELGSADLTLTGAWTQVLELDAFKGKYHKSSTATDTASFTARYLDDVEFIISRHAGANQKIKVTVDGVTQQSLIIDGAVVNAVADEYTLDRGSGADEWHLYDGTDSAVGANPAIIQLTVPTTFKSQTAIVEVRSTGEIWMNAMRIFKRSTRTTVLSIGNDEMGSLRGEMDVESMRNEADIIGGTQGVLESEEGEAINPNNQIFVHTVARAIDLNSIYDEDVLNYVGRRRAVEIYDERILSQDRAEYVSEFALDRYRDLVSSGRTQTLFDPTVEPGDSLKITDEHSRMMDATQMWLENMTEAFTITDQGDGRTAISYVTDFEELNPRSPMPSFTSKPEPLLSDWNNEPIVNIEFKNQGFRNAGKGSTYVATTLTVTVPTTPTSPSWPTDIWKDYWISDDVGTLHPIASNLANTLVLKLEHPGAFAIGTWCITFDPEDTEAIGAPMEIHYDQVVNGRIEISIVDRLRNVITILNDDQRGLISRWGKGKVIFWSGAQQFYHHEGMKNFYFGPYTTARRPNQRRPRDRRGNAAGPADPAGSQVDSRLPLYVQFIIRPETTGVATQINTYSSGNTAVTAPNADMMIDGDHIDVQNSDIGAAKIVPKFLGGGYYLGYRGKGNHSTGAILDSGRLFHVEDKTGNVWWLHIEGKSFTLDEHNGKYIISGKTGIPLLINDTPAAGDYVEVTGQTKEGLERKGFSGWYSPYGTDTVEDTEDGAFPWVKIVTNEEQPIFFKSSDNAGTGLHIELFTEEFFVEGLRSRLFVPQATGLSNGFLFNYELTLEQDLVIHHAGSTYNLAAGLKVKFAQLGDLEHELNYAFSGGNTKITVGLEGVFQFYWSKNDTGKLFFSAGSNPDVNNMEEGVFLVLTVFIANPNTVAAIIVSQPNAPNKAAKGKSFLVLPSTEIHQASKTGAVYFNNETKTHWFSGSSSGSANRIESASENQQYLGFDDIDLFINPPELSLEDSPNLIYFDQNLQESGEAQILTWHFLMKLDVFSKAGRRPINMPRPVIIPDPDDPESQPENFTDDDTYGISIFWFAPTGWSKLILDNDTFGAQIRRHNLNISRAIAPIWWDKD